MNPFIVYHNYTNREYLVFDYARDRENNLVYKATDSAGQITFISDYLLDMYEIVKILINGQWYKPGDLIDY